MTQHRDEIHGDLSPLAMLGAEEKAELIHAMPAEAAAHGIAAMPLPLDEFIAAAPYIDVRPGFACLHVEHCAFDIPTMGHYAGPMMFILAVEYLTIGQLVTGLAEKQSESVEVTTLDYALKGYNSTAN